MKTLKQLIFVLLLLNITFNVEGDEMVLKTSLFNAKWLDAVIAIEIEDENGKNIPSGTGFLVSDDEKQPFIITAGHVIKNKKTGKVYEKISYRRSDNAGEGSTVTETILNGIDSTGWVFSTSYDLACRRFGWDTKLKEPTFIPINQVLSKEILQPGAPLLVLGFPTGLHPEFSNKPLARHGMVSRIDKDKIIIETFVFPGNSGGPVVYVPFLKMGAGISSPLVNEEKLVGVISNYIPYRDIAVSQHTGRERIMFEENSGLSEVIPAEAIEKLIIEYKKKFSLKATVGNSGNK